MDDAVVEAVDEAVDVDSHCGLGSGQKIGLRAPPGWQLPSSALQQRDRIYDVQPSSKEIEGHFSFL